MNETNINHYTALSFKPMLAERVGIVREPVLKYIFFGGGIKNYTMKYLPKFIKRKILLYCFKRVIDYLQRWRVKYAACGKLPEENKKIYDTCAFLNSFIKNHLQ